MAIMDDLLREIVGTITPKALTVGLTRQRGGLARGVSYAEISGRGTDGAWYELRLHHRPADRLLQAGLLLYQPLTRGGRTIVVGELRMDSLDPGVCMTASEQIDQWLDLLATVEQAQPTPTV